LLNKIDFNSLNPGSTQPLVTQTDLKNSPTVIPDYRNIEAYHRLTEPLFQKIDANLNESRTLAELRDTLLPKLMSGELRVA
jgi:type I restriction enzyme S subunit